MTRISKAIAASAIVILLCIGSLSFWSEVQHEEDRGWVTHTHLVIEKLQEILIDVTQAEADQRGYILTAQETYLAPYRATVEEVQKDFTELRELTSDNPSQQELITRLEALIGARLAGLTMRMEIRRSSGLVAVAEALAAGEDGGDAMVRIRALIAEMRQREAEFLSQRLQTAAISGRRMKVLVVCGNTLAILILVVKWLVIHREIGKRNGAEASLKEANVRLERRTTELSETNVELESFSYSVAHDLRAPLRHIAGYSNVLVQDYGPRLDGEARRYLTKIGEGAQKMGHLVDDLLRLSQVGLQELAVESTSLDVLLREVVGDISLECAERKIEWKIGQLFEVKCDPGLMKQVFVNLLSNAVKYTEKLECAVIAVGQTTENGERAVFVRDNGAGFEMQYADKLFGMFQRLHKATDFKGTGVGLAIVQRIVRKHGGRIWAQAEPDRGATFFFTVGSAEMKAESEPKPVMREEAIDVQQC